MSVDHTKVVYYSGYSAYKNVNVFETTIPVIGTTILTGAYHEFTRTITVDEDADFGTIMVKTNESVGSPPRTPSALRWQMYPAANIISLDLNTDPDGNGTLDCSLIVRITGSSVTFAVALFNPSVSSISFTPIEIPVRYAIYTVE